MTSSLCLIPLQHAKLQGIIYQLHHIPESKGNIPGAAKNRASSFLNTFHPHWVDPTGGHADIPQPIFRVVYRRVQDCFNRRQYPKSRDEYPKHNHQPHQRHRLNSLQDKFERLLGGRAIRGDGRFVHFFNVVARHSVRLVWW